MQMQYAPGHCRVTHCPAPGSRVAQSLGVGEVTPAAGEIFTQPGREDATPDPLRQVAWAPNAGAPPPFDCECVEPQYWSFRKAEMHVCGRDDFGPDAI